MFKCAKIHCWAKNIKNKRLTWLSGSAAATGIFIFNKRFY
jgi:hypothetical protein